MVLLQWSLLNILFNTDHTTFALKLGNVHQTGKNKVDLSTEAKSIATVLNDAQNFILSEEIRSNNADPKLLLQSRFVRKLQSSIERWSIVEDKLRQNVSPTSLQQVKLFDDTIINIAGSKALLGHVYWRSNQDDLALKELEESCPLLWEYHAAKQSSDAYGWLDCYIPLSDIYQRKQKSKLLMLESDFQTRLPWLAPLLKQKISSVLFQLRPRSHLLELGRYSRGDRTALCAETRRAWTLADEMRLLLNDFIRRFLAATSAASGDKSAQILIYNEMEDFIKERLNEFKNASNDNDIISGAEPEAGDALHNMKYTDIDIDAPVQEQDRARTLALAAMLQEFSLLTGTGVGSGGAQQQGLVAPPLQLRIEQVREYLHAEMAKESRIYLAVMAHIIDSNEMSADAGKGISRPVVLSVLQGQDSSPSPASGTGMGFQQLDEVLKVFEYFASKGQEQKEKERAARIGKGKDNIKEKSNTKRSSSSSSSRGKPPSRTGAGGRSKTSSSSADTAAPPPPTAAAAPVHDVHAYLHYYLSLLLRVLYNAVLLLTSSAVLGYLLKSSNPSTPNPIAPSSSPVRAHSHRKPPSHRPLHIAPTTVTATADVTPSTLMHTYMQHCLHFLREYRSCVLLSIAFLFDALAHISAYCTSSTNSNTCTPHPAAASSNSNTSTSTSTSCKHDLDLLVSIDDILEDIMSTSSSKHKPNTKNSNNSNTKAKTTTRANASKPLSAVAVANRKSSMSPSPSVPSQLVQVMPAGADIDVIEEAGTTSVSSDEGAVVEVATLTPTEGGDIISTFNLILSSSHDPSCAAAAVVADPLLGDEEREREGEEAFEHSIAEALGLAGFEEEEEEGDWIPVVAAANAPSSNSSTGASSNKLLLLDQKMRKLQEMAIVRPRDHLLLRNNSNKSKAHRATPVTRSNPSPSPSSITNLNPNPNFFFPAKPSSNNKVQPALPLSLPLASPFSAVVVAVLPVPPPAPVSAATPAAWDLSKITSAATSSAPIHALNVPPVAVTTPTRVSYINSNKAQQQQHRTKAAAAAGGNVKQQQGRDKYKSQFLAHPLTVTAPNNDNNNESNNTQSFYGADADAGAGVDMEDMDMDALMYDEYYNQQQQAMQHMHMSMQMYYNTMSMSMPFDPSAASSAAAVPVQCQYMGYPPVHAPSHYYGFGPQMGMPLPLPLPNLIDVIHQIRMQIEYYFSFENLSRDSYLKSMMDSEGYVNLQEIANFKRIQNLLASPQMIVDAVKMSNLVELAVEAESSNINSITCSNSSSSDSVEYGAGTGEYYAQGDTVSNGGNSTDNSFATTDDCEEEGMGMGGHMQLQQMKVRTLINPLQWVTKQQ